MDATGDAVGSSAMGPDEAAPDTAGRAVTAGTPVGAGMAVTAGAAVTIGTLGVRRAS